MGASWDPLRPGAEVATTGDQSRSQERAGRHMCHRQDAHHEGGPSSLQQVAEQADGGACSAPHMPCRQQPCQLRMGDSSQRLHGQRAHRRLQALARRFPAANAFPAESSVRLQHQTLPVQARHQDMVVTACHIAMRGRKHPTQLASSTV